MALTILLCCDDSVSETSDVWVSVQLNVTVYSFNTTKLHKVTTSTDPHKISTNIKVPPSDSVIGWQDQYPSLWRSDWLTGSTSKMLSSPPTTSLSTSSNPPPPRTVTSDPRRIAMETYWREVRSIDEEKEGEEEEEEEEEEERKSMDGKSSWQQSETSSSCVTSTTCLPVEVELEEAWLTEAGLSSLVTGSSLEEASPPPAEVLLSTLTRQQAATVRKRLDNYNETLKTRNRQPIRDVRDIFTEVTHTHTHTHTHNTSLMTTQQSWSLLLWPEKL